MRLCPGTFPTRPGCKGKKTSPVTILTQVHYAAERCKDKGIQPMRAGGRSAMKTKTRSTTATAEIFWTAFQSLPKVEQQEVVSRLASDEEFREDLLDIAVCEERRHEPTRPFRTYLEERSRKKPR